MKGKTKTKKHLTFEHPERGYNLICFRRYQFIGDLCGNLKIEPEPFKFGAHVFTPGRSNVVQIGDEINRHALFTMLRLEGGFSLLYLGVFKADNGKMLMFEPLVDNKPRSLQRNLFGELDGTDYHNLFAAFNVVNKNELLITTSAQAPRCFRPTVIFAPDFSSFK